MTTQLPVRWVAGRRTACILSRQFRPKPALVATVLALFVLALAAVVLAAAMDGALYLTGDGRGLFDHYGFLVSMAAAPIVVLTCCLAIGQFLRVMLELNKLLSPDAAPETVFRIVVPHVRSLLLRGKWKYMLLLLMFCGVGFSIAVFKNLNDPVGYWGNDVFNSVQHVRSYYVANAVLLVIWGVIYPLAVFLAVHLTVSSEMIVARLKIQRLLKLDFLNIDKCGGMSSFGTLNLFIMLIYLGPLAAVLALFLTHSTTYLSLILGGIAVSAAFIFQSVYGLFWVSRAIRSEKEQAIANINTGINTALSSPIEDFVAAVAKLAYRDRILSISSLPYSGPVSAAVNLLRFLPPFIVIVKYLPSH